FHDELGNKLTRISVLTDILQSKSGHTDEEKNIIRQIKENVSGLYSGTKDILWSLNPQSDDLYEIARRLCDFGIELFHETAVNFNFSASHEIFKNVKLPGDYSRNIMMIFKEAMNNVLKHAHAKNVSFHINMTGENILHILLDDDGDGFDMDKIKKGHGIS